MIRYYKLFDLLNRRGMNKSSLLEILSSKTIAKLSKGENINTDVIDRICLFLGCQPSDIMEIITEDEYTETETGKKYKGFEKTIIVEEYGEEGVSITESYIQLGEGDDATLINRDDWPQ